MVTGKRAATGVLLILLFSMLPAESSVFVWLMDGMGNLVDYQDNPIPSNYVEMDAWLERETGLKRPLSIEVADGLWRVDKMLAGYGPLAGNNPEDVSLESVAELLTHNTSLPYENEDLLADFFWRFCFYHSQYLKLFAR